jgi:hypothetical protein
MQAQSEKVGDIFSTMKQTYNDKKEDGLEEIAKEIKEYQDAVRGKADFALDAFTRDGRMAMGRSTTAMSRRPNLWQDLLWPCDRRLKCHLRHLRCMILKDIPTVIHRSLLRLGKLGGFGPFFFASRRRKRELSIPLMSPRFWEWEVGTTAPSACHGNGGYGILPPRFPQEHVTCCDMAGATSCGKIRVWIFVAVGDSNRMGASSQCWPACRHAGMHAGCRLVGRSVSL